MTLTRLLMSKRGILLLDEPTSSIDGPLEEQVTASVIGAVAPGDVLVMVTHKNNLLRQVNRIILMDRGKIAMDGPRDAVLAKLMQNQQAVQSMPTVPRAQAGAA